ncbi:type II secretion system protein [Hydrogenimonas thermophila]|uniref:Prepilin-type N-terminal cleavage/methylation domain-containing protein n=1 Tax=Hydrogenimonas thermophila TaxID=223786 RepID=A0A1I5R2I6_9BACT|nr:type II secretion system protein [Hydrogenimonas thermophila]WOE69718.1 type II secretion system protein [Hydrogenimonas thermophila]WOE72232.1 type II secretion system protein [Hydrogenimonas thermophila]SFP52738.1 prepilin-type N-terminal cleavage/methylation domain-containing protein [Hydrogenimonas thermophila]
MKKAFSLIELIFVMVIIGILAATGVYYFKPNILQRDVDYVLGKIKEARFKGIGYNKFEFNGSYISDPVGCIKLTKDALNNDNTKDETQKYKINDLTTINVSDNVKILCFDYLGRPHSDKNESDGDDNNETRLDTLLHSPLEINVTYNGDSRIILVLPMSGFATVASCN